MEYTLAPRDTEYQGEKLFLIEGTVHDLQIASTTVNLLEQIQRQSRDKQVIAGAAFAANDMYGMAANAADLIFYDGEDMDNFACYLGDELVGGIFAHPLSIANGDYLKAVVSRRGDMCFVHGLMRPVDHSVWMPLNTFQGKKAFFRDCMKLAKGGTIFTAVLMIVGQILFGWPWYFTLLLIISGHVLGVLFELWTYKDFKYFGERAAAIFAVFGFPDPEEFDLKPGRASASRNMPSVEGSFNYMVAIEKHLGVKKTCT